MSSMSHRPWSFAMSARPLICDREYPEPSGLFGSIARSIFVAGGVDSSARARVGGDGFRAVVTSVAGGPLLGTSSLVGGDGGAARACPFPAFRGAPGGV